MDRPGKYIYPGQITGEYWNPGTSRYRENLMRTGAGMVWVILSLRGIQGIAADVTY